MGATPDYVGSYGRPWIINLNTDSGFDDITGVASNNISIIVRNTGVNPPTGGASTGAITIISAFPAQISWQPTSSDYSAGGSFNIVPQVTFPSGPVLYDPISITLKSI
jgi:hypothetical protein